MGNSVQAWRVAIGSFCVCKADASALFFYEEWGKILSSLDLRTFLFVLTVLLIIGNISVNPGPIHNNNGSLLCILCDRTGRKNQVKLICCDCNRYFHTKCLQYSQKQIKSFRNKTLQCTSCALPSFSDSFFENKDGIFNITLI
jgi:hypothetical protein